MTIILEFHLSEKVTPEHLARRVTEACAQFGALRPGEKVVEPLSDKHFTVVNVE